MLLVVAGIARGQADIGADLEIIRGTRSMPGLSAIAVKDGRIVAQGAAGVRRIGSAEPLRADDLVNIASCTKWMTATLAGRLVDRGVITWNTRVRDVFGNYAVFHSAFHDATLDQLLAHRAGIQQGSTFESRHWSQLLARNGTISEIRRWTSEIVMIDPPEVPPGTFLYSNQGYTIAATMLEIASGKSWETLMREEIFSPVRMSSARLGIVYDNTWPPVAPVGHDLYAGQTVPVPRVAMAAAAALRYQASNGAGGYVACTLKDWAKFLHVHMQAGYRAYSLPDYLHSDTAFRLKQPFAGGEGYGRGIDVLNRAWADPGQALSHSGDIWGHNTVTWMAPARGFIVAVFTNCRADDDSVELALDDVAVLLTERYAGAAANGPWLDAAPFITSPAPGSSLVTGSSVGIRVSVKGIPNVQFVEILSNGSPIGYASPSQSFDSYHFDWSGPLAGTHHLQAVATFLPAGAAQPLTIASASVRMNVRYPAEPEIAVRLPNGSDLKDSVSIRNFGRAKTGSGSGARSFLILNAGNAQLEGLKVIVTGIHRRDFRVTQPSRTSVSPGRSVSFNVWFKPRARGSRKATLQVLSNDADEKSFDITLTGQGT